MVSWLLNQLNALFIEHHKHCPSCNAKNQNATLLNTNTKLWLCHQKCKCHYPIEHTQPLTAV